MHMYQYIKYLLFLPILVWSAACGEKAATEGNNAQVISQKEKELSSLKSQREEINSKISVVEAELLQLDPSRAVKPKLVSVATLTTEGFEHFINLQGLVNSNNVSYVAPRNGAGGYVKQVYIKAGQYVKKGQPVLKLDDQILRQAIETTKTQLSFAKNVYTKTQSLWDQGIGTEVQLLTAKTNMESLENQLKVQEEQLSTFMVYADQDGVADIVNIKVGELFTGVTALGAQIQIIGNKDLAVNVDIPENYASSVKAGAKVMIDIPAIGKTIPSTISRLSNAINPSSRGFTAECKIPAGYNVKPNMAATVKILDHSNSKAIVVPVNVIQNDEKSKYVFLMTEGADGKKVTTKRSVVLGKLYGDKVEIVSGLVIGDKLILQGYQNLYEGQKIEDVQ